MQLSPEAFDNFLGANGVIGKDYLWYPSDACPNTDPHSGAHVPGCPACAGKGRIYQPSVPGVAALSGVKTQRDWQQFGVFERGDVVVTIAEDSPLYAISQYDRVTDMNETNAFSLVLTRGAGVRERILGTVLEIDKVFWLAMDKKSIVQGAVPTLDAYGAPTWGDPTTAPPAGTQYTIRGLKNLDYFCFGPYPQKRNMNQGSRLPIKIVLRDWDLFNR